MPIQAPSRRQKPNLSKSWRSSPEDGIGTPASILLVVDDIGDGSGDINGGNTLSQPLTLHLLGGHSPHLRAENVSNAGMGRQVEVDAWVQSHDACMDLQLLENVQGEGSILHGNLTIAKHR